MMARLTTFHGQEIAIQQGEIVLLRGPNGSGKTSILRALAGLSSVLAPRSVACSGPVAWSPQDARDALVGLTVEGEFRLRKKPLPDRIVALARRPSAQLSSGETRRVAIGATAPDARAGGCLLLLDEPAEGLDAQGRDMLRTLILSTAKQGAVVMADHGHAFDEVATRTVHLAPARHAPLASIPRLEGPSRLVATPVALRGRALPEVHLGPGFHVLSGPNASGKSTLLLRLAGLLDAQGVTIDGAPPEPGYAVRLLLPHAGDLLMHERVRDECGPSALVPHDIMDRHPLALSAGESQRVALAKVLGQLAPCYLLDEPEVHLDDAGRALLVEAIAQRVKEGACVLAATHDEALRTLAHSEVRM